MDGAQHRINVLVAQDGFPDATELRTAVNGIQGLTEGVHGNLQSPEVQELGRQLLHQITSLTSFLDARYSLALKELKTEKAERTHLTRDLNSINARQRLAEKEIWEKSAEISRLLKQIDHTARETQESRRKAEEHFSRALQRLDKENLELKKKDKESREKVTIMSEADVSMKSTITNLKKQIVKLREENAELQRKLTKAAPKPSLPPYRAPAAPLTAKNLAVHTTRQAAIEDIDNDSDLLLVESSPKSPPERMMAPAQPLLLDKSLFEPENSSRMPQNPLGRGQKSAPRPGIPEKRKAETDLASFIFTSKSLATGPKRSRRVP
ncbi:hypothetical protein FRB96_002267 [Tulasnella sp. 330]|nr:hypothetical protein FRB96_002267 [Tulasnella sp. 330]